MRINEEFSCSNFSYQKSPEGKRERTQDDSERNVVCKIMRKSTSENLNSGTSSTSSRSGSQQVVTSNSGRAVSASASNQITDHIFLGSQVAAMKSGGPKNVLSLVPTKIAPAHAKTQKAIEVRTLVWKEMVNTLSGGENAYENQKPEDWFQEPFTFINECIQKQEQVLVHCREGISRSASLVMAYLIKHNGMKYQEALDFLKSKRPNVNPDPDFLKGLEAYAEALSKQS